MPSSDRIGYDSIYYSGVFKSLKYSTYILIEGTKLNDAELFNLTTGRTTLINMSSIRFDHQSTMIDSSNKIVLIGGTNENGTVSNSGDVFDGYTFTSVPNQMIYGRRYHTVSYLPTINKILIVGRETTIDCVPKILNTVELYNINTNMFESLTNIIMSSPRSLHTATLLKNNIDILIVDGYSSNEAIDVSYQPIAPCELFNIPTMSTTIIANMNVPRAFHTGILLPTTSDVLCCGDVDSNNTPLSSCERYIS